MEPAKAMRLAGGWPALALAALLAAPATATPCAPDEDTLCLLGGRVAVEVAWSLPTRQGIGHAVPLTDETGLFWFFDAQNVELAVKALDGRPLNGHLWFFYGALSDVHYTITVTDTVTGEVARYENPRGELCGRGDTGALAAPPDGAFAGVALPLAAAEAAPAAEPPPSGQLLGGPAAGEPFPPTASCIPDGRTLCLLDGRLAVRVAWRNQHSVAGTTGIGHAVPLSDETGLFWFFSAANVELVVKGLDGRGLNGRLWLFYGALSDVEYAVTVTDAATGLTRTYVNPPGELCGRADVRAFCDQRHDCEPGIRFASTPVQARLGDPRLFGWRDFDLAADVDVVSLHQDFYGVPWETFADGVSPPAAWVERMDEAVAQARVWGRPVYLSLALVGGDGRAYLSPRVVETPQGVVTEAGWSARCFDFAGDPDAERWRRAYLAYVRWMVRRFDPDFLTQGIEVNLFQSACDPTGPGAYDALVEVLNQAYDAAKEVKPWLPVFPSLQLDALLGSGAGATCPGGDATACLTANLERSAGLERDRFAISYYPHLDEVGGAAVDYGADLDAVLERVTEPAVIAETGYPSVPLVADLATSGAPQCTTLYPFSDERQRAYFDALVAAARRWDMDLVTWWSNRDVFPTAAVASCPCQDPDGFCAIRDLFRSLYPDPVQGEVLFKAFATLGVRNFHGQPKPLLERWEQVRAEERARD
jgi:hypothetical protein